MPVRPEESLAKMIASLKEKTGRSIEEWRAHLTEKGLASHGEIVAHLKGEHQLTHGYAIQIARHMREPEGDLLETMFAKRDLAKQIYDALLPQIQAFGSDVDVAPKKANVSIRRRKQFALLQPAANRLDVGINLKGVDPTDRLEASGSFNAMFTHRVRVASVDEIDAELLSWLRAAYEEA